MLGRCLWMSRRLETTCPADGTIQRDLEFEWAARKCLFCGGYFSVFGRFLSVLGDFINFGGLIFPFLSFFGVRDTVYSQMKVDHV
jgi:hypothetical protein